MKYEIENKISKSPIKTIDLDDFMLDINITVFDIKDWLKDELILIEKDFREKIESYNWSIFKDKQVAIQCSNNAIIPDWAYMLVASKLNSLDIKNFIGEISEYENFLITEKIHSIDLSIYKDKPVIIKGCSGKKFKEFRFFFL